MAPRMKYITSVYSMYLILYLFTTVRLHASTLVALNSLKLRQRPFNLSHRAHFQNKIGHPFSPEPLLVYIPMEGSILRLRSGRVGSKPAVYLRTFQ